MKKATMKSNKRNPANQPFNVKGKKNITKSKAWWQLGNSNNKKFK